MDRTWKIEIRIALGGEARNNYLGSGYLPATGLFAKGSKADEDASEHILTCMRVAARQAIHDLSSDDWLARGRNSGAEMGPGELRGWINQHVRSGAPKDKEA